MAKYLLSEDDRETLNDLIRWWRRSPFNAANRAREAEPDYPGPECYLVRAPAGGIPALGYGADTGTGTGTAALDDVPGSADCEVYDVLDGELSATGFTIEVWNFTNAQVPQGGWVTAVRTKFGAWVVPAFGLEFATC